MAKILLAGFCGFPAANRTGTQLRHIVRALEAQHSVDVLVTRSADRPYVERLGSTRILRVPLADGDFREQLDTFGRALTRQIGGTEYDVVHVRDGHCGSIARQLQSKHRYAFVYDAGRSPLTSLGELFVDKENVGWSEEVDLIRQADLVLAASEPALHYFAAVTHPERVHLVPPGVDVDAFDWDESAGSRPKILYCGPLEPGRGLRFLVAAVCEVNRTVPCELLLAGYGEADFIHSLKQKASQCGYPQAVTFAGEVPYENLSALINEATLCVAPTASDLSHPPTTLYPTKILEYLACGRPVIAARRNTVEGLLHDGENALLFEPGDAADLIGKILQLLSSEELRSKLARAGYAMVRRDYAASATRRDLKRAYRWLSSQPQWKAVFERPKEALTPPLLPGEGSDGISWSGTPNPARAMGSVEEEDDSGGDTAMNDLPDEVTKVEMTGVDEDLLPTRRVPEEDSGSSPRSSEAVFAENRFVAGELIVPDKKRTTKPLDPPGAPENSNVSVSKDEKAESELAPNTLPRLDLGEGGPSFSSES